ncbi:MAG TPA: ATP-binding protein [Chloroflexia bacterium]|nr:ATP-binding protein [Chloroflexia bacterium]
MVDKNTTKQNAERAKSKKNFQQQSLFDMELPQDLDTIDQDTETQGALALKPQVNPEIEARRESFSKVKKGEKDYTSADIQVLEGIQAIRHRPGMYIGATTTSGLMHLIWEALDNSIDEFNAGYGKNIWITIDEEGWVTVRDEGRGMPFDPMKYQGKQLPAATVILTVPHSGGKFEEGAYKTAGGLHGVGTTVINALSEKLELTIWKEGRMFRQEFARGKALMHSVTPCDSHLHGTQMRWKYDRTIFDSDVYYPHEMLESRLKAAAYLNRGVSIHLDLWDENAEAQVKFTFFSKEGLPDYIRDMNAEAQPLFRQVASVIKIKDDVSVEVALQPNKGYKTQLMSFANAVRTRDGGVHETGFKAALTKVVNDYALKYGIIKNREKEGFRPDVIQQGLTAVISVKLHNPQFQGQTKDRLNNGPVEGIVRSIVNEGLSEWMESQTAAAKEWLKKIQAMQKARNEAQLAEELARTGKGKSGELIDTTVSKKFLKCNTGDPSRAELLIVEGDSAGGTASQGRFSDYQAILKLRGKPLNVAKADLEKMVANEEIRTIINVLGTGTRAVFDYSKLKFGKIIFMADADVDGLHIQCLLLTLFHQEFPDLIERGHVYIACPPLYSVKYKGKVIWLLDDTARDDFLRQHPDAANLEFKRFKGLGEMNPKELRETTLDPNTRTLKRVTIEDSLLAAKLVSQLMEDTNAEARRVFLADHARKVAELDY